MVRFAIEKLLKQWVDLHQSEDKKKSLKQCLGLPEKKNY